MNYGKVTYGEEVKLQVGVTGRLGSVEENVKQHEEVLHRHRESTLRDLRYLAEVLGVTLPSDGEIVEAPRDAVGVRLTR